MARHIDMDHFRSLTGGDALLEGELFDIFIESATQCLEGLRCALLLEDHERWGQHAHALKGISLNLGAEWMAEYGREAQAGKLASRSEKEGMVKKISEELGVVQAEISSFLLAD